MTETKRREFEKALITASVKQFLVATPYSSGDKTFLDEVISEDTFFNGLYCESERADLICKEIIERSEKGNTKNIIVPGYKGCGKTTFIHYFEKFTKDRVLLLNFDDYVNRGQGDEIKTIILLHLFRIITDDIFAKKLVCKKMLEIYNSNHNKRFFSRYIDPDNSFKYFFDVLDRVVYKVSKLDIDNFIEEHLKDKLFDMQVHQLLTIYVLYDLSNRIENNLDDKCYIIFDNLDVIDNTVELENFTKDISAFRNNIGYILDNISFEGLTRCGYNAFQDYTLIFCMRETTKAEFIEHFSDRGMEIYIVDNVSSMYDKEEIVQKRYDYLVSLNREELSSLCEAVEIIVLLLKDVYVKDVLIKLFNYDYRTSINVLSELEYNSENILKESISLRYIPMATGWNAFGARSILFGKIFELFKNNYYFEKIKESEYKIPYDDSIMAINITRLILLYLRNSQTLYWDAEKVDNQTISLFELFDDFSKYCDDLSVVVNSIWNMYELRNQSFWNHLVTFDGMSRISLDALKEQMKQYKNGIRSYNRYGRIRITSAGHAYLETLVIHYEYFASRLLGVNKSLFSFEEKDLLGDYNIERVLSGVYDEVIKCIKKVYLFYKVVFEERNSYTEEDFLGSKYAWHKIQDGTTWVSSMFHGERIIHSHIGYLNSFRKYAFYILGSRIEEKRKINKLVIKYIKKYIKMFREDQHIAMCSEMSQTLIQYYGKCISKIEESNYNDFELDINRETGKRLMEEG